MADWTQLPTDILNLISKRFENDFDFSCFRSVCSNWRSSIPPKIIPLPAHITIPYHIPSTEISQFPFTGKLKASHFDLLRRTIFRVTLPEHRTQSGVNGWLVKMEEHEPGKMHLFNPLSISELKPLPINFRKVLLNFRITELAHEYVLEFRRYSHQYGGGMPSRKRAAFLRCSEDEYCVMFVLDHGRSELFLFRSTYNGWTVIEAPCGWWVAVISFKGKFYAVNYKGSTISVDPSGDVSLLANVGSWARNRFLVDSGGELLLIDVLKFAHFKIFKFDEEAKKWVHVKSLGDRTLFLGDYCSFSVPLCEFGFNGAKGNCLIFGKKMYSNADDSYLNEPNWANSNADDLYLRRLKRVKVCPIFDHLQDSWLYNGWDIDDDIPEITEMGELETKDMYLFDLEDSSLKSLKDCPEYFNLLCQEPDW